MNPEPGNPGARLIRDRALIATGQVDKAEPELAALSQRFPQMTDVRLELAAIYVGQKKYDQAIDEYDKIWTANPPDVRGFVGCRP